MVDRRAFLSFGKIHGESCRGEARLTIKKAVNRILLLTASVIWRKDQTA
jgi:hypothetical protein